LAKKKLSKLSDNDEAKLAKLSKKDRAQAVDGQPDQTDIDTLTLLFTIYDKETGGKLMRHFEQLKIERAFIPKLKPIEKAETFKYSFPKDLEEEVRHWWPSIWTNKEHARWFLKKFPGFRAG
jgi:hypothetical protein